MEKQHIHFTLEALIDLMGFQIMLCNMKFLKELKSYGMLL